MTQFRRRVAAVGVAVLALTVSAGTTSASASLTEPPSYVTSWLALKTGTSNTVELVYPDGTRTGPQTLSTGRACAMDQGDKSLLEFSATGLGTGLAGGAIGAREKKNSSGVACSAVDAASKESLTLTLGSGVSPLVAAAASLDIDLKQSARILATARLTGDAEAHYFELQSGTSIGLPALKPEGADGPSATVFTCNNPADSGPDSGANNNCRWEISAPSWTRDSVDPDTPPLLEDGVIFDSLKLEPVTGSFSLMGGADGVVADPAFPTPTYFGSDAGASIFELVEGAVDCGDTVTLRGSIASSWNRLENLGTEECEPYPYSSSTGSESNGKQYAEIVKPLDSQTGAQAVWTTTFVVGNGNTPPPATIELDLANGGTTGEFTLLPCDPSWFDSSGGFVGPDSPPTEEGPTACLVSAVKGKGQASKSATYVVYVYGDARLRV